MKIGSAMPESGLQSTPSAITSAGGAACLSHRRQGGYSASGEAWASPTHIPVTFPLSLPLSHPEPIEGYVELIMVFGYNF